MNAPDFFMLLHSVLPPVMRSELFRDACGLTSNLVYWHMAIIAYVIVYTRVFAYIIHNALERALLYCGTFELLSFKNLW